MTFIETNGLVIHMERKQKDMSSPIGQFDEHATTETTEPTILRMCMNYARERFLEDRVVGNSDQVFLLLLK